MIDFNIWKDEAFNQCLAILNEKNVEDSLNNYLWEIYHNRDIRDAVTAGLRMRYPKRVLSPILHRKDNDDVICATWTSDYANEIPIILVHDFTDEGLEVWGEWDSIIDWLKDENAWQW